MFDDWVEPPVWEPDWVLDPSLPSGAPERDESPERAELDLAEVVASRLDEGWQVPTLPAAGPDCSSEDAAVAAQARLAEADRLQRILDAFRISSLLDAYAASMDDVTVRFGKQFGRREGPGAQAFFRSTGLALKLHPFRVAHLVDTASSARDHLPKTWQQFLLGRTTWQAIDLAVGQADGLEPDRWPAYDDEAAALVVTSTRLKDALRKVRERLQDDTAPARARTTFEQRCTRFEPGADGSATWSMTGPAADQVAFDQALTRAAILEHGRDGETRSVGQLKYDIARDLLIAGIHTASHATTLTHRQNTSTATGIDAVPSATGPTLALPERQGVQVKLILTIPALAWLGHTTEQAQLAGYGPISLDTARQLAGDAKSMIRVLTDPITGVRLAMDQTVYTPPPDLRRWIQTRDQHCRFPGCRRPAHQCDIDHAHEWHDGGITDQTNLISLSRDCHNPKSLGLYRERLRSDGVVEWVDVWGNVFEDPPADPMDPASAHLLPERNDDLGDDEPCPF